MTNECWWFISKNYELLCMDRGAWAGWVQAIGSIGAIFFAYFYGRVQEGRQIDNERAKKCEQQAEELEGIVEVVRAIRARIVVYYRKPTYFGFFKRKASIVRLRETLEKIPLHQHPFSAVAANLVALIDRIDEFLVETTSAFETHFKTPARKEEQQGEANRSCERAIKECQSVEHAVYEALDLIRLRNGL